MTVYRKIMQVKTIGSRTTNDLRPLINDNLPQGINLSVLEYDENAGTCILECWCCDHAVLQEQDQKTDADLEELAKDKAVIKRLTEHPLSPPILGGLHAMLHDSVDDERKEITVHGRKGKFLRKEKFKDHFGKERDLWILDEG